jgi:aspartyl protease family protein
MGTFKETVLIVNFEKPELKTELECVVDTGATYTWIPSEILERLEVRPRFKRKFKIADGTVIEKDMAEVLIEMSGERHHTLVVFGNKGSEPLLGAVTLEEFSLMVDPVSRNLVSVPAYLYWENGIQGGFYESGKVCR